MWATAEAHRTGTDVASRIAKDGKKTLRAPEVRAYLEFDPSDRIVGAVYVGEFVEHSPNAPDREVDKHLTIRSQ